jgi:dihydroorotate dehydrogenase electron transfer subunit
MPEEDETPVVVAGGIGIASLFPLVEHLAGRCHVLYGARNCHELFLMDELRTLSKELLVSTDDGSQGERGPIVGLLHGLLSRQTPPKAKPVLYACGPRPMLKAVRDAVGQRGISAYVSMEENMACGIGACLGCVVKTVNGHKRVCKEGPVFPIEEIVW